MNIDKKSYIQVFDSTRNSFTELDNSSSGIYSSYNDADLYSNDPAGKVVYSGLKIPIFKTNVIISNPVLIGQLIASVGPGINIGEWNRTDSPYSMRLTGDGGEIAIGSSNFVISGIENMSLGHFNMSYQSKLINIYGKGNYADNSNYSWILGAYNFLSGISLSNVLGKNNTLWANNNVEAFKNGDPAVFTGWSSYMINTIGDYNNITNGAVELTSVGNYNQFTNSYNVRSYGNYNNSISATGYDNLMLGNRNNLNITFDGTTIGNENTISNSNGDLLFGKTNNSTNGYYNYVFGKNNALNTTSQNTIFGNSNTILGSYNQIFGRSITNFSNSLYDTVIGDTNSLSGTYSNYIIGSNNTSDSSILLELAATNYPFLTGKFINNGAITGEGGDYNFYLGNSIRGSMNDNTFSIGESNNLINNYRTYSIGRSNQLVSNQNSYVFGYNNQITGSSNAIFVGFNFISGTAGEGIKGVGIKITPNGVDIYGTLKVNGTTMNVP
jgi:hypothetical protein